MQPRAHRLLLLLPLLIAGCSTQVEVSTETRNPSETTESVEKSHTMVGVKMLADREEPSDEKSVRPEDQSPTVEIEGNRNFAIVVEGNLVSDPDHRPTPPPAKKPTWNTKIPWPTKLRETNSWTVNCYLAVCRQTELAIRRAEAIGRGRRHTLPPRPNDRLPRPIPSLARLPVGPWLHRQSQQAAGSLVDLKAVTRVPDRTLDAFHSGRFACFALSPRAESERNRIRHGRTRVVRRSAEARNHHGGYAVYAGVDWLCGRFGKNDYALFRRSSQRILRTPAEFTRRPTDCAQCSNASHDNGPRHKCRHSVERGPSNP